ncbi:MAG: RluA family pseudouridine synthase [Dehalococcoidia bacterium]|nr:RluA family pseudouridine synthase [Dehalococcoidia bacterium]
MNQNQSPQKRIFEAGAESGRLDKYLADICTDITRAQIQKLIENGNVMVNGRIERPSYKLHSGELVEMTVSPPDSIVLVPEDIPFDVIYEDLDIVIINKPAGLAVYPAPGHPGHTLANAVFNRFPDLAVFGNSLRPGIVHRLDKDTSGLIVIARNERARIFLINEFKSRAVKKHYLVLVKGKLMPENGAIDAPIGRDPANRKKMAIVSKGREARTGYRVIEYLNGYSLVEAHLKTGRTHQIRVHFAAIGHPVFGDSVYGVRSKLLSRQFLHASYLELKLPSNGQTRSFSLELPDDLKDVFKKLRRC